MIPNASRTFFKISTFGILLILIVGGCAQTKSLFRMKSGEETAQEFTAEEEKDRQDSLVAVQKEEELERKKGESAFDKNTKVTLDDAVRADALSYPEEAEKLYRLFIQQNEPTKNDTEKQKEELAYAYKKLGIFRAQRKEFAASEVMFQKAIDLSPNDPEIIGAYAQSLRDQKKFPETETVVRDCMKSHRSDVRLQYLLGQSLLEQKRYQEGFRYLKQAIGEPQAYQQMAKAYHEHGDVAAANLAMKKLDNYYISRKMTVPQQAAINSIPSAKPPVASTVSESSPIQLAQAPPQYIQMPLPSPSLAASPHPSTPWPPYSPPQVQSPQIPTWAFQETPVQNPPMAWEPPAQKTYDWEPPYPSAAVSSAPKIATATSYPPLNTPSVTPKIDPPLVAPSQTHPHQKNIPDIIVTVPANPDVMIKMDNKN